MTRSARVSSTDRRLIAVAGVAGALRVLAAVFADPVVVIDSSRYWDPADPWLPFQPWRTGGPGVLSQIWFLLPLRTAVVVQTLVSAVVVVIAVAVAIRTVDERLRTPVALGLLAWTLSPWFVIWDVWVLTEAAALAGCCLAGVGAARIVLVRASSWPLVTGCAIAITARPFTLLVLVPLVALAIVFSRRRPKPLTLVALGATLVFGLVSVMVFEDARATPDDASVTAIRAADRLALRHEIDGYLDSARAHGMPDCEPVDAQLRGGGRVGVIGLLHAPCPEFQAWLESGGLPWQTELIENPVATLRAAVAPRQWVDPLDDYWPLDGRLYTLSEAADGWWLPMLRLLGVAMPMALVGLAVAAAARGDTRERAFVALMLSALAVGAAITWAVDPLEVWRHTLPAFAVAWPMLAVIAARVSPHSSAD